jgi:hypothetical protein
MISKLPGFLDQRLSNQFDLRGAGMSLMLFPINSEQLCPN